MEFRNDTTRPDQRYFSRTIVAIYLFISHVLAALCHFNGSKVLHSPYCSLSRMHFFSHVQCFLFFFSNKLAAPKLLASVIKESTTISLSSAIFKKSGFSTQVFPGKSTTKSGWAPMMEFSQNQTCRRPGQRPEMSGRVWSGPCPSSGIWP